MLNTHAHTHVRIHTHTHAHTHTPVRTYTHAHTPACPHTRIFTHSLTRTHCLPTRSTRSARALSARALSACPPSWNQFWNGGGGTDPGPERTAWIDCPDPMVRPPNSKQKGAGPAQCAADVKALCNVDSYAQKYAMIYTFAPGCHGSDSVRRRIFEIFSVAKYVH